MAYRNPKIAESPSYSPPRSLSFASPRSGSGYAKGSQGISEGILSPGATGKLEHVSEKFAALYSDLEQEKKSRKLAEVSKVQGLQESLQKFEKSLEVEVKRRAESDKQLQQHIDSEINRVEARLGNQLTDLQTALKDEVANLSGRIQELFGVIREERDQRRSDNEHLGTSLVDKLNECVQAIEAERNIRVTEQALNSKRIGEDLLLLQQKIDSEIISRDNSMAQLKNELHEVLGNRNVADEQFRNFTVEEIAKLKTACQNEREERIAEDDEIVQAINDYTRALQEGLKIVNS